MTKETRNFSDDDLNKLEDIETTITSTPPHLPDFETEQSVILIFSGNPKALQFELQDVAVVGRHHLDTYPDVDLAPYGGFPAGVSRNHARFIRREDGIYVEDMGSANGTFVSERRLSSGEQHRLRNGEAVRFAQLQSWFYFEATR